MKSQQDKYSGLEVRYTQPSDAHYLKSWLADPDGGRWFPIDGDQELDDAVLRWISFQRYHCSITVLKEGVPCGIATLYLQPYAKLAHQCEFGIIIGKQYRGQYVGRYLMSCLIHLAKEKFGIEILHLTVYEDNPAIEFYHKFGFVEFGRQVDWIKEKEGYFGRVFMQKTL